MLFLTASAAAQPDYVALGMVLVMAVIVAIMTLRKYLSKKNGPQQVSVPAPVTVTADAAPEAPKPTAPGSAGKLKLHDVEPKTAAMLMAITADKIGKPLNELRFISIKEVK